MAKILAFHFAGTIIGLIMFLIGGCFGKSKPAQFYLLTSLEPPAVASSAETADTPISVGLEPVTFPEYLNRPQIVLRTLGSEIKVAEFNRWAEPLKENFTRVLAQNLVVLLNTDSVWLFPWSSKIKVDYQVGVNVERFDVIAGRQAQLNARWTIFSVKAKSFLRKQRAVIQKEVKSSKFEDLVAAQNAVLQDFSQQIAEEIKVLYAEQ